MLRLMPKFACGQQLLMRRSALHQAAHKLLVVYKAGAGGVDRGGKCSNITRLQACKQAAYTCTLKGC